MSFNAIPENKTCENFRIYSRESLSTIFNNVLLKQVLDAKKTFFKHPKHVLTKNTENDHFKVPHYI